jgi:methylenetetrahydrofolate dehydrogenase (NAD+)
MIVTNCPPPSKFLLISMDGPASCKVVLAGPVAKGLLSEVADGLSKLQRAPLLVGFLANADPPARMYADWTDRTCKEK